MPDAARGQAMYKRRLAANARTEGGEEARLPEAIYASPHEAPSCLRSDSK
eukprot:CAMPEP_0195027746 /NCGR_PEP_ID=MMETSP0326_2-20130528/52937_1 /TAXON_ID=2866 ORGANISM="Crypthecodinium cohnii, Strain Seligo" /NCGR_SAMPLE_ID=MMETSP0326_2 /ASSEMBLY_ACC=CAM_ASM_000348 /LENGTH=49 /DNA_ID= /DNA_START= /DNA_END= /DNA_ORIENTATION=